MNGAIKPLEWQERALRVPPDVNLFLGGGRGGGKSFCAALLALQHCAMYPDRARVLVVRETHGANSDFADTLESLLIAGWGRERVTRNRQEHVIRIATGAQVEFGQIDAGSYNKYQGKEYSLIVVEEAGALPSLRPVDRLRSNLRVPGLPCRCVYVANPGGTQHSLLIRRHVSGRIPWHPYDLDGERWITVPSVYLENRFIDHERYAIRLAASVGNDRALAKAWLSGDWLSGVSGAFFADVLSTELWLPSPDADEWRELFKQCRGKWATYTSTDHGWSAPSVALLCARAMSAGAVGPGDRPYQPGSVVVLDELATVAGDDPNEGGGWPAAMIAEAVLDRCRRWGVDPVGVIDDARSMVDGTTLIQQFQRCGLSLRRPRKDRAGGWTLLKAMMAATRDGDPDQPGAWISDRCRYLAETLPVLQRNPLRPEDIQGYPKQPDHGADALRYAVSYEPPAPRTFAAPITVEIR